MTHWGRHNGEPSTRLPAAKGEQSWSPEDIAAFALLRNVTFVIFAPGTFLASVL